MTRRSPLPIEDIRSRILKAALSLFEARGFHAVAVPEIARAAGLAVGSLYRVAPSKEALANQLFQSVKSQFNRHIFAPFPARRGLRERFGILWARLTEWTLKEPVAARFLELHNHTTYLDVASEALEMPWRDAATAFAWEGHVTSTLKPLTPEALSALVRGPITQLLRADAATADNLAALETAIWHALARSTPDLAKV